MSSLHIVNKSPFERNALDSCLRLAAKGSAVLLFEDGVIGAEIVFVRIDTREGGVQILEAIVSDAERV